MINSAIIGLGIISEIHINSIKKCGGNIVAVCDIDEKKLEGFSCAKYTDYKKMIEEQKIDVVHICTPHYLHPQMSIDCANKGINVLVEKPAATDSESLKKMMEHKTINVCFQNRYNSSTIEAKKLLDEGKYGKIIGIMGIVPWYRSDEYYTGSNWRGKLATEGGCLLVNQAIHTVDLMQYLVGEVKSVKAHADNFTHQGIIEGEDSVMAAFYYKNGITGMFFATNSYNSGSTIQIEIKCEKATLKIDERGLYIDGKLHIANDTTDKKSYYGSSHEILISELYSYISGNGGSRIIIDEALPACQIIEAIYKSSSSLKNCSFE